MGIASVGHDLFPKVNKLLSEYLTPHILSAVRSEIAQCLYFIASKVESNIIKDPGVSITDGCIEDKYDAKQTLLKSMIAEVGEERVCELWKITDDAGATILFVSQEAMQNFLGITLVPNPLAIPTTVTHVLYRATKKKMKYVEVWRLARQATQLAVEHDSHGEIIGWLKKFIDKHKEIEIAQNQDLMEVQVNDNKENEPLQVENLLVS
ncbi:unnamed protein product [Rhizophagus irregularis]|nr:unnamed protein product [Rhizophagus irregularis]